MTLPRDFRLSKDVLPRRYALRFDLDLDGWTFRARERIELEVRAPRRDLVLHAVDLELDRAVARRAGRELVAELTWEAAAEAVALRFPEALAEGGWTLELECRGPIRQDLKAIYRSTQGEDRYVVTQLAAADARRAFACFDEPEFKARFALELVGPSGLVAIANSRQLATEDLGGGRTLWRFAETPLISSYLLAFALGPWDGTEVVRTKSGIPVRVWVPRGMAGRALHSRDFHRESLEWLEWYTGIPYPYDKVEAIGVPDFAAGAMENPGAVTYRLHVLAADPATASQATLKLGAEYIAHELTHMWWGDLATFAWWDDVWLNEAFATFVGHKADAALRPSWRFWRDFLLQVVEGFELDALASTHPVSTPAPTVDEALQRFDRISYRKGGAVLRMLEAYLGDDVFQRGVRLYLERFREANATAADFWRALGDASGQDVTKIASAWIAEPGHPLVDARLSTEGRLELAQRRFFTDPAVPATAQRWPVPLVLRTERGEARALLEAAEGSVDVPPGSWVFPNARSVGFYRYRLDPALRARMLAALAKLDPEERLGLVDNDWALLHAGALDAADYVALLRALERESDRAVLTLLMDQLRWLSSNVVPDAQRGAFEDLVSRIYSPQLARLGYAPRASETADDQQLRAIVIRVLGTVARLPAVRQEAGRLVRGHLEGRRLDRNVIQALAMAAAVDGDESLHARYLAHRRASSGDVQEETRFLLPLAFFEDRRAAEATIRATFDGTIRGQDVMYLLEEGVQNRAARELYLRAIGEHWDERLAGLDHQIRQYLIRGLSRVGLPLGPAMADLLRAKRTDDSTEMTAQALERLRLGVAAAERIRVQLESALAAGVVAAREGARA